MVDARGLGPREGNLVGVRVPSILPMVDKEISNGDGCPQVGVGGVHSKSYFEGGSCEWCGVEALYDDGDGVCEGDVV